MDKKNLYKEVSDKLIESLKAGTAPWQRPWVQTAHMGAPLNGTTSRKYSGVNQVLLFLEQMEKGYSSPNWATFKQATEKGWKVKKGSKSTGVYFFKMLEVDGLNKDTGEVEKKKIPMLQCYPVFNFDQLDGAPKFEREHFEWKPVAAVEAIRERLGVRVEHEGNSCFYRRDEDFINMVPKDAFPTAEKYAATLCHEMAHATGHESRLNRQLGGSFGDELYAKEELRAEIASFMLAIQHGIEHNPENHASYVKSWIKILEDDPREIFKACRDAEKICDFMNGVKLDNELEGEDKKREWKLSAGQGKTVIITDDKGLQTNLIGPVMINKHCESHNIPEHIKNDALSMYTRLKTESMSVDTKKPAGLNIERKNAHTPQESPSFNISP